MLLYGVFLILPKKNAKTKRAFKQTLNLCVWMNVLPSIIK